MVGIFALSSIPGHTKVGRWNLLLHVKPQWQNLLRIPLFALLQILWLRAFTRTRRHGTPVMLVCVSTSLIYSLADKLHQLYVPGRYASLLDVGLNIIGGGLNSIFYRFIDNNVNKDT